MSRRRLMPLLAVLAAAALMLLLGGIASSHSYGPSPTPTWVVSGGKSDPTHIPAAVNSVAVSGPTAYLGGNFDYVGPETGSFVGVDAASSALVSPWPTVGGDVYAAASDGSGGFFIGGLFGSIGTKHADNIAHIKADGTLDTAWSGSTNGTVYAIQVSGTTVFAGGAFTQAGGATHANLAAFDKTNGTVSGSFNANATGTNAFVAALRLTGSTLYVGGAFSNLGDVTRTNIGAVATNGTVTAWQPTTNGIVYALAVSAAGAVYAGGTFTAVTGDTERFYGAAFNVSNAAVTGWDPDPDAPIYALEVFGTTVYAGGAFTDIGSTPASRTGLAALTATGGDVTNWNPHLTGQVFTISAPGDGSTVYVGGAFSGVNSLARDNVAAIDATSANATSFETVVGGEVDALAVSGTTIGLGGQFRTAGGGAGPTPAPLHRSNLAAIDLTTGNATSWNPRANDDVEVVTVGGSRVYAGGEFTIVNGNVARDRLAAFDMSLGNATPWNPGVHNGGVLALAVSGSTVYAGGSFHGASAVSANPAVLRNRLAAFQADGVGNGFGDLLPWNPNASVAGAVDEGAVFALDVFGGTVAVGGSFNRLRDTVVRNHLAAVPADPALVGAPTSWDPNVSDSVFTLAHAGSVEYAGGPFTLVNGSLLRPAAAAFDTAGKATAWNPQLLRNGTTAGSVYSLAPSGSTMYVSGIFRTVGGLWTNGVCAPPCFLSPEVAAVSLTTGAPNTSWAPAANGLVASIALSQQGLVLGGQFTALGFPPGGTTPVNPDEPAASYHGSVGLVRALPDAPNPVTATAGNGTATVTFQPPAYTGGATITSYTLTVNPGGTVMNDVTSPVSVPNLLNGTLYTFSVTATTGGGTGEPGTATANPHTIPGAPTGVTGVPGNLQVTVSFNPPADNGGEAVSVYTVKASSGLTITGTASPIVVTGLQNDTPVTFTVTAENSAGKGPESAPSDPVIPIEPGRKHPTPPGPVPRPAVPDVPPGLPPRIPPPHHT